MGVHVAGEAPAMDRLVDDTISAVGAEIDALAVPKLLGVVLGGGYGRGEGGVLVSPDGRESLSNDLDFYVVAEDGSSDAEIAAIGEALKPVSERWTARLGVDVDFCVAKTPWRLRHDQDRIMIQELIHGYFDVAGMKGEALFAGVERRDPSSFPWMEAARLLMNRGAGLILAGESDDGRFIVRNINKAILGAGDARLVVRGAYRWRVAERAQALGDRLYYDAMEWKFRPVEAAVCDWERARKAWLDAYDEIMGVGGAAKARTAYSAVRWVVRRRTLGDLKSIGLDPVVRVLCGIADAIRLRSPFPESLKKDWMIFN